MLKVRRWLFGLAGVVAFLALTQAGVPVWLLLVTVVALLLPAVLLPGWRRPIVKAAIVLGMLVAISGWGYYAATKPWEKKEPILMVDCVPADLPETNSQLVVLSRLAGVSAMGWSGTSQSDPREHAAAVNRCSLTNYGDSPLVSVEFDVMANFYGVEQLGNVEVFCRDSPNQKPTETHSGRVRLSAIDARDGRIEFYLYNISTDRCVAVSVSPVASVLVLGENSPRSVRWTLSPHLSELRPKGGVLLMPNEAFVKAEPA